jgi:hypothetical protein
VDQQLVTLKDWDGIAAKANAVCAALAGLEGSLKQWQAVGGEKNNGSKQWV